MGAGHRVNSSHEVASEQLLPARRGDIYTRMPRTIERKSLNGSSGRALVKMSAGIMSVGLKLTEMMWRWYRSRMYDAQRSKCLVRAVSPCALMMSIAAWLSVKVEMQLLILPGRSSAQTFRVAASA